MAAAESPTAIPETVIDALRYVRDEGPPELELCDEDNVLFVAHCCGLDVAYHWLCDHRERYFDAVRQATAPAGALPAP